MKKLFALAVALPLVLAAEVASAAPTKSFTIASASLPSDIEILGTSNLKQLKSTETFKKLFPELLKLGGGKLGDGIDKIKKACSIDPVSAFDDATLGLDAREEGAVFLAMNGVTEQKFLDCMAKIAKAEGASITTKKSGSVTEVKSDKSSKALYFGWLTGDVLVLATHPDDKALLEKMVGGRGALAKSKIATRLVKIDSSAALSVVFAREIPIDKMTMKSGDFTVTSSGGNVNITAGAEMASSKEAEKVAAAAKVIGSFISLPASAPKEVEKILKSIDAKANGREVTVTAQSTERDLVAVAGWGLRLVLGGR